MKQPIMQFVEGTTLVEGRTLPPVGAQVRVNYRIREGEKERIQAFEGTVIRHHDGNRSMSTTFTVRKMSQGFGVERIFPLHSPLVESIKVNRLGRVRRAKLYFLREREGKKARLREVSREVSDKAAKDAAPPGSDKAAKDAAPAGEAKGA
jgi:large subunit ribosomal protein L19